MSKIIVNILARGCREQADGVSVIEVAPLFPEGEEKEEVGELLIVIVVEFVDYHVVKVADELAEDVALIVTLVLEIQTVVEDVRVRHHHEWLLLGIIR